MTTITTEVYEAFLKAGVPDKDAKEAAKALSSETLATKADFHLLKWMVGFNLAFTMAIIWKVFSQNAID